jgi:hypothetical protein
MIDTNVSYSKEDVGKNLYRKKPIIHLSLNKKY